VKNYLVNGQIPECGCGRHPRHGQRRARELKGPGEHRRGAGGEAGGHRRRLGALPAGGPGRCGGRAGGGVPARAAGRGPFGGHAALLRAGLAALVSVPVGRGVAWDRAARAEARDFCRWLLVAGKPRRPHWRRHGEAETTVWASGAGSPTAATPYAASVRAHSETVLRGFYDFHRDAGTGPILNPFPLDRSRRGRRAHAHHNPMEPHRNQRVGLYRPTVPTRIPRSIPDEVFNELFARLPSHRDRALVAFAGGLLRLHRRPRLRAAVGHPGRRGPGTAADRRSPQGQPAPPGAAGVHRRVRVVAALPAGAGRRHPTRAAAAAVVDAAPPAPAAFLPRGASHVRAGRRPRASR
jgi:hypothetical protein